MSIVLVLQLRPRLEQQRRMGKLHFANDAEFEAYFAEHLQGAYEKVVDEKVCIVCHS
jgi:hypothetical protein